MRQQSARNKLGAVEGSGGYSCRADDAAGAGRAGAARNELVAARDHQRYRTKWTWSNFKTEQQMALEQFKARRNRPMTALKPRGSARETKIASAGRMGAGRQQRAKWEDVAYQQAKSVNILTAWRPR